MKAAANILLAIFFVIFYLVALITGTFRFGILNYNFLTNTFTKHNVYENLAISTKASFENQIFVKGGSKNDITVLTDLITTDNAKDVVNKNLNNSLSYLNGKTNQINVYLPIDKVPKNLLPKNLAGLTTEVPLTTLLTKINAQDIQVSDLEQISRLGEALTFVFVISISILVVLSIFLIVLISAGKNAWGIAVAFMSSGIITLFFVGILSTINKNIPISLAKSVSVATVVFRTVMPSIITEIASKWMIIGIITTIVGLSLFFVRKPSRSSLHANLKK